VELITMISNGSLSDHFLCKGDSLFFPHKPPYPVSVHYGFWCITFPRLGLGFVSFSLRV
ncbi:predicted protein, partial [Arabidopsis lyrata subsp. lyrata]